MINNHSLYALTKYPLSMDDLVMTVHGHLPVAQPDVVTACRVMSLKGVAEDKVESRVEASLTRH